MGKRYGRNQKRRAREEIAGLKKERDHHKREALSCNSRMCALIEFERRVCNIVGELSVAHAVPIRLQRNRAGDFQAGTIEKMPFDCANSCESHGLNSAITFRTRSETLRTLEVRAEVREDLSRMLHAEVEIGGWKAGFAISDAALHKMPRDMLIEDLSRQISRQLVDAIRK